MVKMAACAHRPLAGGPVASGLMDHSEQTVLVIEPDRQVLDVTRTSLQQAGFRVETARDGKEARDRLLQAHPDLVLLEKTLPDIAGVELCRWIRTTSSIAVILASDRPSAVDTDAAFDAGADDYVTKPYRMAEVVARVRAALRRPHGPADVLSGRLTKVRVGDVLVDLAGHTVWVRGSAVVLPLREFQLLAALVAAAGRVLTRDEIMQRVWGATPDSGTKSLDVHIQRLRRRIEEDPSRPARIVTVRGVGYTFTAHG
jgi:two-component system, OmpR family, response regulator RegX3